MALRIAGAVLAAGSGVRMGRPKADLELGGQRLVDRAVHALAAAGCAPVVAVVRTGTVVAGAVVVVNLEPERGMRSSLRLAVAAVDPAVDPVVDPAVDPFVDPCVDAAVEPAVDALAVLLVDLPGIGADAVRATIAEWRPGRIAVATYDGRRGHPTVMTPALWQSALALAGPDEGARALLRDHPELVDEIAVDGDPADVDTPEQLRRWRGGH